MFKSTRHTRLIWRITTLDRQTTRSSHHTSLRAVSRGGIPEHQVFILKLCNYKESSCKVTRAHGFGNSACRNVKASHLSSPRRLKLVFVGRRVARLCLKAVTNLVNTSDSLPSRLYLVAYYHYCDNGKSVAHHGRTRQYHDQPRFS